MDLVDIDKVLDDLESLEETAPSRNAPSAPPSRGYLESPNRRIKVRSVLSSLNEYVDYDRKAPDKPCTIPEPTTIVLPADPDTQKSSCEQTAGYDVNKAAVATPLIGSHIAAAIATDSALTVPPPGAIRVNNGNGQHRPATPSEPPLVAGVIDPEEKPSNAIPTTDDTPGAAAAAFLRPDDDQGDQCQSDIPKVSTIEGPNERNKKPLVALDTCSKPSSSPPPPITATTSESELHNNNTNNIAVVDDRLEVAEAHVTADPHVVKPDVASECDPNSVKDVDAVVPEEEDEDDLERYLDNLVEEYDKSVEMHKQQLDTTEKEEQEEAVPVAVEKTVVAIRQIDRESVSEGQANAVKPVTPESSPGKEVAKADEETQAMDDGDNKSVTESTGESLPALPSDQELSMDDLRELEKLIAQQEREEQMEMDRQMALKLQEGDDAELVQSMVGEAAAAEASEADNEPTQASTEAAEAPLSASPASSENPGTASGVSPLEAPRSTSARAAVLEETPEYRYLMNLGKVAPYWVPDTSHDSCMQCDQKFSLLKRRHHCRCCGELLCASCCSFRAFLEYMRDQQQLMAASTSTAATPSSSSSIGASPDWPEARICTKCDALVQRRDELLQLRYLAECGIGEDSGLAEFPIKGVLKKPKGKAGAGDGGEADEDDDDTTTDNSDSQATPTKKVIFSDGVRPGHDEFTDEAAQRTRRRSRAKPVQVAAMAQEAIEPVAVVQQSPTESEMVARALNSYKSFVTSLKMFYNVQGQSYLPPIKQHLPPLLKNYGGFLPVVELKNDFHSCLELCEFLKEERRDFLVQKRLYCAVKIIDYRVDANQLDNQCRWCLNVTTNGMRLLGQEEFVILVEMNPEYFTNNASPVVDKRNLKFLLLLLRRLFGHFNKIYTGIHSEISVDLRTKRKMDAQSDPYFLLLDNHVVVTPSQYYNKGYVPALGGSKAVDPDSSSGPNGNESDESDSNYICDKYTFLKPKHRFIQHMALQKVTFGVKGDAEFYLDFNAILYVHASLQSTQNVILPDRSCGQVLFGLLVKQTEIPWAKLFPLRLLLRMGAEYRLYPWPLFNALDRKCLYSEFVDNSIIHFLADFRNFSFTLNEIPGLYMHMEHDKVIPSVPDADKQDNVRVTIYLPKINYKRIEAMINDSSESILSFGGALNPKADGHLVCIQQDGSKSSSGSIAYSTQSLNIERSEAAAGTENDGGRSTSRTGLNFFILNGALKSATGLKAKMSIIEDGVMVQVLPTIMARVRSALLEMRDFEIKCEESEDKSGSAGSGKVDGGAAAASEVIQIVWTNAPVIETMIGYKSEIDDRSLENCSYVNMICDYYSRRESSKSPGQSSRMFGLRSGNSRLEMDCFYLHMHRVVLIGEDNYFALFNDKMVLAADRGEGGAEGESAASTDENANLIKSLNVNNWEVPSMNFLVKLSALLGRFVDKALHRHYSKLYDEKLRQIGVRFQFDRDQMVTYEAGSRGTKLPMAFMNDLDSQLIPMMHHILDLNKKDAPNLMQYGESHKNGGVGGGLGHNLNAEFLDRINLLQNLQRPVTFELVFDVVVDLP